MMEKKQAIFEIIWSLLLLNTSINFHAAFLDKIKEIGILRRASRGRENGGRGGRVIYHFKSSYPEILSCSPSILLAEDGKQKGFDRPLQLLFVLPPLFLLVLSTTTM